MWAGSNPDAPNWQGSRDEEGEITELYTVSTNPPTYTNPKIGLTNGNEVELPRTYNDFNVNDLTAVEINGNPNFDASNWWRYVAKGNVTAELLPPPIIPPVIQTRQYDLTGWKDVKCTNLICEADPLVGGDVTCQRAFAPRIIGTDAEFSTSEEGLADVNIYGANLAPTDNALYVEGGTTLTGGGIVHGVTIGALRAGPVDTVRIDVLPVGMTLTSATFIGANAVGAVEVAAGGAASMSAGGALSLAGGSYVEYNSDQHYFRNTSAGNDFTDMYVGNIHGADGGTAPLRINEGRGIELTSTGNVNISGDGGLDITSSVGGVNITNAKSIEMFSERTEWSYDLLYNVDDVVYSNNEAYRAFVPSKGLSPEMTNINEWLASQFYVVGNVAFVTGVGAYRCTADINSNTTPNADPAHWAIISTSKLVSTVWDPIFPTPFVSTITGDKVSTLNMGVVNTQTINLATKPTFPDWDGGTLYNVGTVIHRGAFNYVSVIKNINVDPSATRFQAWVSGSSYVVGNFVEQTGVGNYQCIRDIPSSTMTPSADPTYFAPFSAGFAGIWNLYTPASVVSTINGDANSVLTIGTIGTTTIDAVTISTNSITPHSGSVVAINSGNLSLADNDIVNVTKISTRNLAAPSGVPVTLQSDISGLSQDGTLRSLYNLSLVQTVCEPGADAAVDFMYSDTTLAMEIKADEVANTASIRSDVPFDITCANSMNLVTTGTAITDNLNLQSAKQINLTTPTNAVRVQSNTFLAIAQNTISLAAVNNELALTATNSNIEFNAPNGLVKANNDLQLNQSRWSIPDTTDFSWVRWWYDGLSYSLDAGSSWIAIASDWWKFAAQGLVNFAGNGIENLTTINGHEIYSYGQYYMTNSQYPAVADTVETVLLDTAVNEVEMTLSSNEVKLNKSGVYQITIDACVEHLSGPASLVSAWLSLNGVDVDNTTQQTRVSSGVEFATISCTHIVSVAGGDTIGARFASSNVDAGFSYAPAITSPYAAPARPAFSLSILLIG